MTDTAKSIEAEDRKTHLVKAADTLRQEMEALSLAVRDLVLAQPPIQLLGYLLAQFHMAVWSDVSQAVDEYRPNKDTVKRFQLALEYAHAVWSCHSDLTEESGQLDEAMATQLFQVLEQLESKTMMYCMASSAANIDHDERRNSSDTEFRAKSSWTLIRGHRYQVLEEEFFRFVLEPHADALRNAYAMEYEGIAAGIQAIANTLRTGFSDAVATMTERMDQAHRLVAETGDDIETVMERLKKDDSSFETVMSGAMRDMFFGGVCNLSRHTHLSASLLEDISYVPGENSSFFEQGDFVGTPMRTLPARIKPGIKLGGEYYATDGQFVRDSAYRSIQWGMWKRLPYRDEWLKRQGLLVERAYPAIFVDQLRGAQTYGSVFYRDVQSGDWAETDLLILVDDILFVIEAKAGVMPMQSPATNFASHERVIQELIVKAYLQCKRFLNYLASEPEVALYNLIDGDYVEIARIRKASFRLILPIGLTIEAFTPFSAMAKELSEVQPILGCHPFVSMSVDDLFVLKRFLPTTGELIHYLEVRQQLAGIPSAMLFDETDHLGAYISRNRFDMDIREQLKTADQVTWDSFSDVVDQHFEGPDWETTAVPSQTFPAALATLLLELDRHRPSGWLKMDAFLRNFGGDGRENFAHFVDELEQTLARHPRRRFQFGEENPIQMWLCRAGANPTPQEVQYQAEVGCLAVGAREMMVLIVSYSEPRQISGVVCKSFAAPSVLNRDYGDLKAEAERQRGRMVTVAKAAGSKKRKRQ